jgi:hypothetical protein
MICCGSGSGSDFGRVLVPAPVPASVPDPDNIKHFPKTKTCTKSCIQCRKLASHFKFLTFLLHFMLDPDPNPAPEPEP